MLDVALPGPGLDADDGRLAAGVAVLLAYFEGCTAARRLVHDRIRLAKIFAGIRTVDIRCPGWSARNLGYVETGRRRGPIKRRLIKAYATACGVDMEWLAEGHSRRGLKYDVAQVVQAVVGDDGGERIDPPWMWPFTDWAWQTWGHPHLRRLEAHAWRRALWERPNAVLELSPAELDRVRRLRIQTQEPVASGVLGAALGLI